MNRDDVDNYLRGVHRHEQDVLDSVKQTDYSGALRHLGELMTDAYFLRRALIDLTVN